MNYKNEYNFGKYMSFEQESEAEEKEAAEPELIFEDNTVYEVDSDCIKRKR